MLALVASAKQNQCLSFISQKLPRTLHRVTGAKLFRLQRKHNIAVRDLALHDLMLVADDQTNLSRIRAARRLYHIVNQTFSPDPMYHLRKI